MQRLKSIGQFNMPELTISAIQLQAADVWSLPNKPRF